MKKILILFLLAFAFMPAISARAADDGWVINSFDSQITVQSNGVVAVIETIAVDFGSQQKHGIYRYIPYKYQNDDGSYTYTKLDAVSITRDADNETYDESTTNGNVEFQIGNSNKTISGKHTYQIKYNATGILRSFDKYDELYWNVTGSDWPVDIISATVEVTLPANGLVQSKCYFGVTKSASQCQAGDSTLHSVNYIDKNILPGANMTVAVGYTKGMVPIITVSDPYDLGDSGTLALFGGFFFAIICGIAILFRKWWKTGRDRRFIKAPSGGIGGQEEPVPFGYKESIAPEFAPPKGYKPAEIGIVIDEKVDTVDITATIVDLAIRGYLTITEIPKEGILSKTGYRLKKSNKSTGSLLEYEKYLYDSLFALGQNNEVATTDLRNKFYTNLNELKDKLYLRVSENKLFTQNPSKIRQIYLIWGIIFLIVVPGGVGAAVFSVLPITTVFAGLLLGILIGLGIVGALTLLFVKAMAARTALGHEVYQKALGYKLFVTTAERYRQKFMEDQNIFMEVLPYAMIFNCTEKLAKAFKDMGVEPPQPTWYMGNGPFNLILFSSAMNNFSSTFSSSMASTPGGSGSGGGGFSGGGFGGGGGGSW